MLQNAVKHTYSSLGFQNFPGVIPPEPPHIRGGEGREGEGGKGEERGGKEGPPQQCLPQGPHQPKSGPG